jgi:hypothetical protein
MQTQPVTYGQIDQIACKNEVFARKWFKHVLFFGIMSFPCATFVNIVTWVTQQHIALRTWSPAPQRPPGAIWNGGQRPCHRGWGLGGWKIRETTRKSRYLWLNFRVEVLISVGLPENTLGESDDVHWWCSLVTSNCQRLLNTQISTIFHRPTSRQRGLVCGVWSKEYSESLAAKWLVPHALKMFYHCDLIITFKERTLKQLNLTSKAFHDE